MSLLTKEYWEKVKHTQKELREKIEKDHWRLRYHQMPYTGWLNDPNGACQFNGTYHLYHQYVPENPEGGTPHWAHKTSKDMVHFKEEDIFLSPEHDYEKNGVFSGSAFVKDNEIHFFYTGNVKNEGDHDYTFSGREQNTIHVVSKDGFSVDYQEVVIKHEEYPEGFTDHIRDPKVFEKNGIYYMVLGGRTRKNEGSILVYRSKDLYEWTYQGIILDELEDMGYMWECPDFFELNGKSVLILSPQGLHPKGYEYHNIHQSGFYIGETDWDAVRFSPESEFVELDRGFDFYAPQTFEDESGRRILWGWMGLGDTKPDYINPTFSRGWQHALTLPRELTIEEGQLRQRPLPEYKTLRQEGVKLDIDLANESTFESDQLQGEVFEAVLTIEEINESLTLLLRQDTKIEFKDGVLTLEHGPSGYGRRKRSIALDTLEQLHIFSDSSSLEIFINDGKYVMTTRVYPEESKNQFVIEGNAKLTVQKWDLKN